MEPKQTAEPESEVPLKVGRSTARRVGWAVLGGVLVSCLPYAVAKVGSNILVPLFVLLWPREFVGMAVGGWNARLLTVFVTVVTNIAFYASLIYMVLTKLENWKQAKPSND